MSIAVAVVKRSHTALAIQRQRVYELKCRQRERKAQVLFRVSVVEAHRQGVRRQIEARREGRGSESDLAIGQAMLDKAVEELVAECEAYARTRALLRNAERSLDQMEAE